MKPSEFLEKTILELFGYLDLQAAVSIEKESESDTLIIVIKGEDLGHLIGYKGEVVNALQSFLYSASRKEFGEPVRLQVDVNDYRQKRIENIKKMVETAVKRVEDTNKPYKFGNLTSFERRLIHTQVAESYSDLVSYSVGEGSERRLVVSKSELS
jgi:spoIIIJ-associated protein